MSKIWGTCQALVYGNKEKYLSAVIVPDFEELGLWSKEKDIEYALPGILRHADVLKLYQDQIAQALGQFSGLEHPKEFKLVAREWTQENDLSTPTLKLKREKILDKEKG